MINSASSDGQAMAIILLTNLAHQGSQAAWLSKEAEEERLTRY